MLNAFKDIRLSGSFILDLVIRIRVQMLLDRIMYLSYSGNCDVSVTETSLDVWFVLTNVKIWLNLYICNDFCIKIVHAFRC